MNMTYEELQIILEDHIRSGYMIDITDWLLWWDIRPQSCLGILLTNHAYRCGYSRIHTTKE